MVLLVIVIPLCAIRSICAANWAGFAALLGLDSDSIARRQEVGVRLVRIGYWGKLRIAIVA